MLAGFQTASRGNTSQLARNDPSLGATYGGQVANLRPERGDFVHCQSGRAGPVTDR